MQVEISILYKVLRKRIYIITDPVVVIDVQAYSTANSIVNVFSFMGFL
jgi:hypothetical protein